jgi:hypothetical protein
VVVPAGNWNVDSKVVIEDGSHAANGSVVQCWLIANGTVLTLVDTAEIGGAATNGKSVLSQIINSGSFTTGRSTGIELSCGQVANIGPNVSVISSSLRVTPAGAFK